MTIVPSTTSFTLDLLPDRLAICRLEPEQADLDWELGEGLLSVTFTDDEVSVVCEEAFAPADAEVSRGWRGLRVVGPLDLGMVGVLAALAGVLAGAGIPVFVLIDTDHILVATPSSPTRSPACAPPWLCRTECQPLLGPRQPPLGVPRPPASRRLVTAVASRRSPNANSDAVTAKCEPKLLDMS
jgi:hypothetical protein